MSQSQLASIQTADRRQLRSESPYRAAELYLCRLKGQKVLHAAAISDRTGLPLAGIGEPSELELLALWGALSCAEQERYQSTLDDFCRNAQGVSWNFTLGDDGFSVSGIAASSACASMVELDLQRILAPLT